jgi:hypothetical protein
MIGEDRLQLNDRFIKVFQMLEDKGVIIKNDRSGKGIGDVAEKVLGNKGYGHIIRAFLNAEDKRVISYSQARMFCREYGINEDYLLDGTGSPFGFDIPQRTSFEPAAGFKGNILFTTAEAFAGVAIDVEKTEDKSWFSLPGIDGNGLVAFHIKGNSMEPVILNNDIVVCREIERFDQLKDNDIYAIKSNGALWVKYIQRVFHGGRITHLKLISANHLEHDPFIEEVSIHTRLYKVIRKITNL